MYRPQFNRNRKCIDRIFIIHAGFEVFTAVVMKQTCLPPACLLVFAELISSTLKMEAIYSSEMSVETQPTTLRHIAEDDTLHLSSRLYNEFAMSFV
jgi:hypothetical protein